MIVGLMAEQKRKMLRNLLVLRSMGESLPYVG